MPNRTHKNVQTQNNAGGKHDKQKIKRSLPPPTFNLTASKSDQKATSKVPEYLLPKKKISRNNTRRKYKFGTHGSKASEQKRLKALFSKAVSGSTHESEHPIGFEPINQTNESKRGSNVRAKRLENFAPAYQERYAHHRKHIGTGNRKTVDHSGFNAKTYRDTQRTLLMDNQPGVAVQINQLGYGQDNQFRFSKDVDQLQSNESYQQMARDVKQFNIANDYDDVNGTRIERDALVSFQPGDYKEMMASRATALLKRYLNPMERSLFNYVIDGTLNFNAFLLACSTGDFKAILKFLGLEELQEHFDNYYKEYRKSERFELDYEFLLKKGDRVDVGNIMDLGNDI